MITLLPSIINVARENNLIINERSLTKKEVLCKCPFCLMDASRPKKFYLSLNPKENIFKCWYWCDLFYYNRDMQEK
ncbi:hypothetical protein [Heyndrickxia oleronia]|uniref:hypothetical protein n=1 Tax=Heyndrickxia oleronia TaxID=38875 RepID=UPI002468DEDC|nr:hypothetical protein [Heyndrickxia oleronia]